MNIISLLPKPQILRSLRHRIGPHGIILMYHRIAHAAYDPWNLCVAPENFAQHLEILRRHAAIVPLSGLMTAISTGNRDRLPVAITFDDGYADNAVHARPILERYDAPATFFIATGFIGRQKEFWSDRLARLVLGAALLPDPLVVSIGGQGCSFSRQALGRRGVLEALWRRMRPLTEPEQDKVLRELQTLIGIDERADAEQFPMSVPQVAGLASCELFEIGAHTRTHCQLPSRSAADQMAEIADSKHDCEQITGKRVTQLAYPYGWYDAGSVECARAAGYGLACTTAPHVATQRSSVYALPRIAAADVDGDAFARGLALKFSSLCMRIPLAA